MNWQTFKLFIRWNVVLVVLLLASLASNASADVVGADGASVVPSTQDPEIINGSALDALVSVTTDKLSTDHTHVCVVTASAAAERRSGDGTYIFGLSMDAEGTTRAGSNRRIEMTSNDIVDDVSFQEVSTTFAFTGVRGSHTFTFSARRVSGSGTIKVNASSITIVCTQKQI